MVQLAVFPPAPMMPGACDPDLARECERAFGMKAKEVLAFERIPEGLMMTDLAPPNRQWVHRTVPDRLGRTGLQQVAKPGLPLAPGAPLFESDSGAPPVDQGRPWTAVELFYGGSRVRIPYRLQPGGVLAWVRDAPPGEIPVRASAVIARVALRCGSIEAAIKTDRTASACWDEVAGSGLLAADEEERYATWRGVLPGYESRERPRPGGDAA